MTWDQRIDKAKEVGRFTEEDQKEAMGLLEDTILTFGKSGPVTVATSKFQYHVSKNEMMPAFYSLNLLAGVYGARDF